MITFTGNYITSTRIPALKDDGNLINKKIDFYELNPKSVDDNKLVEGLVDYWAEEDTLVREIERNFKYNKHHEVSTPKEKFFVISEHNGTRDKVTPQKVLGIVQTSKRTKNQNIEIDYLQTLPQNVKKGKKYTPYNVGSALLDLLKKIFPNKNFWLYSTSDTVDFYKKNGFRQISKSIVGLPMLKYVQK